MGASILSGLTVPPVITKEVLVEADLQAAEFASLFGFSGSGLADLEKARHVSRRTTEVLLEMILVSPGTMKELAMLLRDEKVGIDRADARGRAGLSPKNFTKLFDVTNHYMSRWEQGVCPPIRSTEMLLNLIVRFPLEMKYCAFARLLWRIDTGKDFSKLGLDGYLREYFQLVRSVFWHDAEKQELPMKKAYETFEGRCAPSLWKFVRYPLKG
jgi:DNA-binding transcriptional regulator YiaG